MKCSLPAFEGLFPGEHDGRVQDLLFTMAHWHALAKLRMHTDSSLQTLDSWTSLLGESARAFVVLTCSRFETQELKAEYEARKRKEARASTKKKGAQGEKQDLVEGSSSSPLGMASPNPPPPFIVKLMDPLEASSVANPKPQPKTRREYNIAPFPCRL